MSGQALHDTTRPRVLLSGALPPPMGGIGAFYQILLGSSFPAKVQMRFVQTSSQKRTLSMSGRASLGNLVSAVGDCLRFAAAVFRHRPQISHIATAFGLSFVKHGICAWMAHAFGSRVLLHPHCSLSALYTEMPWWWQWLFRRVIGCCHGVIGLSSEWLQLKSILPKCRLDLLPNAIPTEAYRAVAEKRITRRGQDETVRVLYLGTVGRAKGELRPD